MTYGYDRAGQLNRMTSEKDGFTYDFITDMTYDVYGNIATKTYGNGTTTRYTYDPKRQHLTSMVASNSQGEFINARYSYDAIDNILGITNTAKPVSTIGGTSHHSYTHLRRLQPSGQRRRQLQGRIGGLQPEHGVRCDEQSAA